MDSLLAVELKKRLESALGVTLETTVAFTRPTVRAMSDYLADEVFEWEAGEAAQAATPEAEIENLGQDEIELEIQKKLARLEALVHGS
jgi:hypothetical protein